MSQFSVTVWGCGYIGSRVARHFAELGETVAAIVRRQVHAEKLLEKGISAQELDLDASIAPKTRPESKLLYYFIPPSTEGEGDNRISVFLRMFMQDQSLPERVVLISTTGVYGDCQGEIIDESRPVHPETNRAKRRVDQENQLRSFCQTNNIQLVVLRVAGIYGPDRLPIERIKQGSPLLRSDECPWLNLIHADDLAQLCILAGTRSGVSALYNVSDGVPTTMTEYMLEVADCFGLSRPEIISRPEAERRLPAAMLSYLRESRRIDNQKMVRELKIYLRYPDFKQGIRAIASHILN